MKKWSEYAYFILFDEYMRRYPIYLLMIIPLLVSCGGGDSIIPPFTMYTGIDVADLNADAKADVVTSNIYVDSAPPHPGHISVILQDQMQAGMFENGVDYPVGPDPWFVAADDLNDDGRADLMATSNLNGSLTILLQSSAEPGSFLPSAPLRVADHPRGVVSADINGDGLNDVLVTGSYLAMLLNTPGSPGTFVDGGTIATNSFIDSVAAGDIDGDGRVDLVVDGPASDVLVFLQDPAPSLPGAFSNMAGYNAGERQHDVELADLDGDNKLDIVVTLLGTSAADSASRVSVLIQDHDPLARGQFLPATSYVTGNDSWDAAVGDLNHDNLPDLAVANSIGESVSILLQGSSPGVFLDAVSILTNDTGLGAHAVAIGDLNEDGYNDIALADHYGAVLLYQNAQTPGSFLAPEIIDR